MDELLPRKLSAEKPPAPSVRQLKLVGLLYEEIPPEGEMEMVPLEKLANSLRFGVQLIVIVSVF